MERPVDPGTAPVGIHSLRNVGSDALRAMMDARGVRLPNLALGSAASVLIADAELRILDVVGPSYQHPGFRSEDLVGRSMIDVLVPEQDREWLTERIVAARDGEPQQFEFVGPGGERAYRVQMFPLGMGASGGPAVISINEEITDQIHLTMELTRAQARLNDVERMIGVGSWELSLADRTITFSSGYARALGLAEDESLDVPGLIERVHPDDRAGVEAAIQHCVKHGSAEGAMRIVRPDGTIRMFEVRGEMVPGSAGEPRFVRGAVLDVTDQRERERERVEAVSLFRKGFDAAPIGMAIVDPATGRYVRVNDALCRLLGRTREELAALTVADVVYLEELENANDIRRRLVTGEIVDYHGERRYDRPDGAVVWAAIHLARVAGPEGPANAIFVQFVDVTEEKRREAATEQELRSAHWLERIRDALDHHRLTLYAQPIVDLRTGETVQQELLLRMLDDGGAVIAPAEFLGVAERYGVIAEIDRWVICEAVRLAASGMRCEFNLSGASIGDPVVIGTLEAELERTGADPGLLVVEVTETAMMKQLEVGREFASRVTQLGCGLALDDFGTGFSSLAYLKHIPAGCLKIDQEFVRDLPGSERDERVVRGILGLAREFGQIVVAEGIEDEATLAALRALGVDHGQGYLFGYPQPLATPPSTPGPVVAGQHERVADPVAAARVVLQAFAARDLEAGYALVHPDIVVRPYRTMEILGRTEPYRGLDGLRNFRDDILAVWDELEVVPAGFRETDGGVIAFGQLTGTRNGRSETSDVIWVFRFRGERLVSVDVVGVAQA